MSLNSVTKVLLELVLFCAGVGGLTLALSIPLQNHCIDGECGGCSCCESCGSALGFLAAAATQVPVAGISLRGLSLSCPWNVVQLGVFTSNSR